MPGSFKLLMTAVATVLVSAGLGLSGASAAVPAAQIAGDGVLVRGDDDDDDVIDPNGPIFSEPGKIDNAYLPITAFERCEMRGTETTDEGTAEKVAVKKLLDRTKEFEVNGQDVEAVVIRDKSWLDG